MGGFVRRYGFFPDAATLGQIEGVVIVDLPPPGVITGTGVGTTALVGEFADVTYGVAVSASGVVSTKPQPVEIFSSQDLLNKVGGFDETLGDTGISGGSGFIALRNKKFSRLILVPINNASASACRLFRQLPSNASATSPVAVVPTSAAAVAAGREFKSGSNRIRSAALVVFTGLGPYTQGIDGAVTAGSGAVTQTFASAGGAFTTALAGNSVALGDLLVLGVISGAGAQGANAGTYRVTAVTDATDLVVEKLDGSSFNWTSGTALAWRIHPGTDGDSAATGNSLTATGGYDVPARPLDATISAAVVVGPTVVPPAATANSWDPLSGLKMATHPSSAVTYTAGVQAPNAASAAAIDALYSTAIDALLSQDQPASDVNIVTAARKSATIRAKLNSNAQVSSGGGVGRVTVVAPELSVQSTTSAIAAGDPGVAANRNERVFYTWPGEKTFIPEAVGFNMKGADGLVYADGNLDVHMDMRLASILSNLPPERNPGQAAAPVPALMATVQGYQRGVSGLQLADYIQLKAQGVAALKMDRTDGPIIQSGVTTSLTPGQKNINRRRMADYIEDNLAAIYSPFSKLPITDSWKDAIVSETISFLEGLLSKDNPPAQRISGYLVDDKSGNTASALAAGIFVVISKVQTTPTADVIVAQAEIGEAVDVTTN